jgi:predicted CxxxxCH...CXXCH cytochrome family protein
VSVRTRRTSRRATHAAIACPECHRVPSALEDLGHADTAAPAELVFGELARSHGAEPRYDEGSRRCADTYCHGPASPAWNETTGDGLGCASCHGAPPPAPHPRSEQCAACHGDVVDERGRIIAPEAHVDGRVQRAEPSCSACHGGEANAAPPPSTTGATSGSSPGVGAHQVHLAGGGGGRALACSECHGVPDAALAHPAGEAARVVLSGVAATAGRTALWDAPSGTCSETWCHGPSAGASGVSPSWTADAALGCTSCHGAPPAAPHPQVQNCGLCHGEIIDRGSMTIAQRSRHVDGIVDVTLPEGCDGCHGDASGAPPPDLDAGTSSAASGVGAHPAHLAPSGWARPVTCSECHRVPAELTSVGHVDSVAPAEIVFSGVAVAFGAAPRYAAGSCAETFCHGDSFVGGRPSGGVQTRPDWSAGASAVASCRSCHGMPPPAPHPEDAAACGDCHRNVDAELEFSAPRTHIDGVVTFFLPAAAP